MGLSGNFQKKMGSTHHSDTRARDSFFTSDSVALPVAIGLIVAAAFAWYAAYYLMNSAVGMNTSSDIVPSALPISGMSMLFSTFDLGVFSLFVLAWTVGMLAMMFPTMIPVGSFYFKTMEKTGLSSKAAKTVGIMIFLGGYLILYVVLGFAAYFAVFVAFQLGAIFPSSSTYSTQVAGIVLVGAGVWQFTPYKDTCVKHCVSPLGFFLTHAKNGLGGALRMGVEHGFYCVGCCYLYMIVMLSVAAMSLPSMALLAIVITLEKVIVKGAKWFTWLVGTGFITLGIAVWFVPELLLIV